MTEQRICIVGAGSAGLGVGVNVLQALKREGLSTEEAADRFWVVDQYGLMGKGREELSMHQVGQRLHRVQSSATTCSRSSCTIKAKGGRAVIYYRTMSSRPMYSIPKALLALTHRHLLVARSSHTAYEPIYIRWIVRTRRSSCERTWRMRRA
jgi:hypothetical protein